MDPGIRRRARARQRERWLRYNVLYPLNSLLGKLAFPFRHPLLWIWLRRADLHRWLGFEMPEPPKSRHGYRRWV